MHSVGDSVAFFKGFGAFAEKIVVSERMAFPIPKSFSSQDSSWRFYGLWHKLSWPCSKSKN